MDFKITFDGHWNKMKIKKVAVAPATATFFYAGAHETFARSDSDENALKQ
jgi:hypothetical protein